jgi:hypothetical protein
VDRRDVGANGRAGVQHADAGREWRLGTNEAFVMNLSGANAHGGGLSYYIEELD